MSYNHPQPPAGRDPAQFPDSLIDPGPVNIEQGYWMPRLSIRPFTPGPDITITEGTYRGSHGLWQLVGQVCHYQFLIDGTISYADGIKTETPKLYLPFPPMNLAWWNYPTIGSPLYDSNTWAAASGMTDVFLGVQDSADGTEANDRFNHAVFQMNDGAGDYVSNFTLEKGWGATGGSISLYGVGSYWVDKGTTGKDLLEPA